LRPESDMDAFEVTAVPLASNSPMLAQAVSCRTLVVEDDPSGREILITVLSRLGHEVETAKTVHQALRLLETFKPTHMLLDLMLPDGSGAELLEKVREEKLPVKVALVTGAGSTRFWDEAIKHSPDAVFRKPWNLSELKAWLEA